MSSVLRVLVGEGGPSDEELERLWRAHGQDVGAAADAYFRSLEQQTAPYRAPAAPASPCRDTLPASSSRGETCWPLRLGECVVDGISLVRQADVTPLHPGEELELVTSSLAAGQANGAGRQGKQRKIDQTVRFRRTGNDPKDRAHPLAEAPTLGRLPALVAQALLPLLASGNLHVQATVARQPAALQLLSTIHVRLVLSLERGIFGGDLAARRAEVADRVGSNFLIKSSGKPIGGRAAGGSGGMVGELTEGRALMRLIDLVGLQAEGPPAALAHADAVMVSEDQSSRSNTTRPSVMSMPATREAATHTNDSIADQEVLDTDLRSSPSDGDGDNEMDVHPGSYAPECMRDDSHDKAGEVIVTAVEASPAGSDLASRFQEGTMQAETICTSKTMPLMHSADEPVSNQEVQSVPGQTDASLAICHDSDRATQNNSELGEAATTVPSVGVSAREPLAEPPSSRSRRNEIEPVTTDHIRISPPLSTSDCVHIVASVAHTIVGCKPHRSGTRCSQNVAPDVLELSSLGEVSSQGEPALSNLDGKLTEVSETIVRREAGVEDNCIKFKEFLGVQDAPGAMEDDSESTDVPRLRASPDESQLSSAATSAGNAPVAPSTVVSEVSKTENYLAADAEDPLVTEAVSEQELAAIACPQREAPSHASEPVTSIAFPGVVFPECPRAADVAREAASNDACREEAGAPQDRPSSAGRFELSAEVRERIERNRRAALLRRQGSSSTNETGVPCNQRADFQPPTLPSGSVEDVAPPVELSEELRALVAAKRAAAQRRRAEAEAERREREAAAERRAAIARLGPLKAGFLMAKQAAKGSGAQIGTKLGPKLGQATGMPMSQHYGEAGRPSATIDVCEAPNCGSHHDGIVATNEGNAVSCSHPNSEGAEGVNVDAEELSTEELCDIYEGLSATSASLASLDPPPTLRTELHPYQKQALWWMSQREEREHADMVTWRRYVLADGTAFYVEPRTGAASLTPPKGEGAARGGILADAMGLGKTVQMIALLLHDRWKLHMQATAEVVEGDGGGSADVPNGADGAKNQSTAEREEDDCESFSMHTSEDDGFVQDSGPSAVAQATTASAKNAFQALMVQRSGLGVAPQSKVSSKRSASGTRDVRNIRPRRNDGEAAVGADHAPALSLLKAVVGPTSTQPPRMQTSAGMIDSTGTSIDKSSRLVAKGGVLRRARDAGRAGGATLIICPTSLLGQWADELQQRAGCTEASRGAGGGLQLLFFYGGKREELPPVLTSCMVVLTSYGTVASEWAQTIGASSPAAFVGSRRRVSSSGAITSPLFSVVWRRVVLDEAHAIKTHTTQVANAVFALRAERRWVITGTPIQNCVGELFSLLHFLRVPGPAESMGEWSQAMAQPGRLALLQRILRPLMLRRTKETVDASGKPILQLPPRRSKLVRIPFSPAEADYYRALHSRSKTQFDAYVAEGKLLSNYASVLELLLRLRQACDHPYLAQSRGGLGASRSVISKRVSEAGKSSSHATTLLNKTRASLAATTQGSEGRSDNTATSCIAATAADSSAEADECPVCLDPIDDAVLTSCLHTFCRECILHVFGEAKRAACPLCRTVIIRGELTTLPRSSRFTVDLNDGTACASSAKIDALLSELRAEFEREKSEAQTAARKPDGGKDADDELGGSRRPLKAVVFSQWVGMLDLVEAAIARELSVKTVRLDGSLSLDRRREVLAAFREDPKVRVMLLSLRAGNVGLNLTSAQRVYLLDPWWNPAVEEQALNRVHRIGQIDEVVVVRLVVHGTVEEKMLELQERKRRNSNLLLDDAAGGKDEEAARQLRMQDLALCFA